MSSPPVRPRHPLEPVRIRTPPPPDINRLKELHEPSIEAIVFHRPSIASLAWPVGGVSQQLRELLEEQQQAVQSRQIDAGYLRPQRGGAGKGSGGPSQITSTLLAVSDKPLLASAQAPAGQALLAAPAHRTTSDPRVAEIVDRSEAVAKKFKGISADEIILRIGSQDLGDLSGPTHRSTTSPRRTSPRSTSSLTMSSHFDPAPFSAPFVKVNVMHASHGTIVFQPWRRTACVMFIDLSGYSRITTALAHRGPHVVSEVVNNYMTRIISIVVAEFHGEIANFAGDAIMAVFVSSEGNIAECCVAACACAVQLQKVCGTHVAIEDDPSLVFRLHIGIACDVLESVVLYNPRVKHMLQATHFLTGPVVSLLAPLVDSAAAGETAVSQSVVDLCGGVISTQPMADPEDRDKHFLVAVGGENESSDILARAVDCVGKYSFIAPTSESVILGAVDDENDEGDEDCVVDMDLVLPLFVHPVVSKRLELSTKLASEECEMRFLCVMFIHKSTIPGVVIPVEDWFLVVQEVLDRHRCPVIKLIDDDKGIHAVAAVNLFAAEERPALVGVAAAIELTCREIGTSIGMACGSVFCGAVGSPLASRWDISGAAAVRACRLMQHALRNREELRGCCCDPSVYEHIGDVSALAKARTPAVIKGTEGPVTVYCLAKASQEKEAWKVISPAVACADCHQREYDAMVAAVESAAVGAIVINGPAGIGKQTLAVRALVGSGVVAVGHVAEPTALPLAIAESIAGWYMHHTMDEVRRTASAVMTTWRASRIDATVDGLTKLAHLVMNQPRSTFSVVVRNSQNLDTLSFSFLRSVVGSLTSQALPAGNKFFVVLCVTPAVGSRFHVEFPASQAMLSLTLLPVPLQVSAAIAEHRATWRIEHALRDLIADKSFGIPAHIAALVTHIQAQRPYITRMSADGTVCATANALDIIRQWRWQAVAPAMTPSLTQLLDQLPAGLHIVLRILAAATNCESAGPVPAWVIERVAQRHLRKKFDPATSWTLMSNVHAVRTSWNLADPGVAAKGRRQSISALCSAGMVLYVQLFSETLRDVVVGSAVPEHLVACAGECLAVIDKWGSPDLLPGQARHCLRAQLLLTQGKAEQALQELPAMGDSIASATGEWLCDRLRDECQRKLSIPAVSHETSPPVPFVPMPMEIVRVKNLQPPLALGPAAPLLCKLAWRMRCNYLDAVAGRTSVADSFSCDVACRTPTNQLVARYGRIMVRIAKLIGEQGPFHRTVLVKEQASLTKWLTFSPSPEVMTTSAGEFVRHVEETCGRRAAMLSESAYRWRTRASGDILQLHEKDSGPKTSALDGLRKTLRSAVVATLRSEVGLEHVFAVNAEDFGRNLKPSEREVLDAGFHRSLVALSMGGFAPEHPKLSLEAIRGYLLQKETENYATFGSFVYIHYELSDIL